MFLLGSIIFTVILTILINIFFLKEKQRDWLAKYSTWAILPVWLCIIPILIFHTETVRHTFIFLQWCFIAPQGLGVYYMKKKLDVQRKDADLQLITLLERAVIDCKNNGYIDAAEQYQAQIDKIKNPISFWKKIKNKLKNIF